MKRLITITMLGALSMATLLQAAPQKDYWNDETPGEKDARMKWWNEARFGMFLHWGLYSTLEGEWQGNKKHAEWIRTTAKIPLETYNQLLDRFNPTNFDADAWVKTARDAGMKYIVITTKHHEGFCLWPSKVSDFTVMQTPYKKDIIGAMTKACKKYGIRMCFYYSIMDWHHPDYLPRRNWEKNARPEGDADYDRYVEYMKAQLKELITTYHPASIWFDGEWESTWTHERGKDLYQYVRSLDPDIIVNNRVDKGRKGMGGMTKDNASRGDYGTPEQQIPAKGFPKGVYWESCMTMNGHWGWNKNDRNWKSDKDLIRKLVDVASKGGNYLLNIGPKPDGTFPQEALDRLQSIGKWMKINSESIYGTSASPLGKVDFGRCTVKKLSDRTTRLYLHVFNRPTDGRLTIPITNAVKRAYLLADKKQDLAVQTNPFSITLKMPEKMPDTIDSVIAVDIEGDPQVVKIDPYADETKAEHDARMKWWRDAKFGMFIHWGVYAVPAGIYKGKQIPDLGEWIMLRAKIPVAEYKQFAKEFNPTNYNPEAWAAMAKDAGIKYIVITAKHHDGFALFDSKASDWNVADATPYKKDLLKPLVEAAKKNDLKIGFYYSQAQDWTNPGGAKSHYKEGEYWDPAQAGSFDDYLKNIAAPQVDELLSNYDIDVIWWDTPWWMNKTRAEMILPLLNKKPGIIHNNRLGGGYKGDTDTPEQYIPDMGIPGRDWETCMTMNRTWGYKSYDNDWKSSKTLIRNLVDVVSKGGNYLLNVGPKPDGTFPQASIDRLKDIGAWMKVNGEAIYGTQASPVNKPAWGRITLKADGKNTILYLFIFDWPQDGVLELKLANKPISAELLADRDRKITTENRDGAIRLQIPEKSPDPVCPVVKLLIEGKPQTIEGKPQKTDKTTH